MKRLMVLAVVVMIIGSSVGCQCCNWFRRGAYGANSCPMPAYGQACPDPCDPCATGGVSPGPGNYVPGSP
jgi:hypothetical protein